MQTTITLDEDVAAAVDNFSRQEGVGISEAVFPRKPYVHRTADLGLRMDVSNIGEVLEFLDATDDR